MASGRMLKNTVVRMKAVRACSSRPAPQTAQAQLRRGAPTMAEAIPALTQARREVVVTDTP